MKTFGLKCATPMPAVARLLTEERPARFLLEAFQKHRRNHALPYGSTTQAFSGIFTNGVCVSPAFGIATCTKKSNAIGIEKFTQAYERWTW